MEKLIFVFYNMVLIGDVISFIDHHTETGVLEGAEADDLSNEENKYDTEVD